MTVRTSAAAAVILTATIAGCGAPATETPHLPPVNARAASLQEGFSTMDRLVEAARKEGSLTVIALPRDWVNYGEIIDAFADEYGIKVNQVEPDASSARAIEVAGSLKPDVFDLSMDVAVANAGAFAPYKVQGWQDIPDHLKDQRGNWYAGYGGYMSIGYRPDSAPAPSSFSDLLKPGYKVSLAGDPRQVSAAFNGVMAASIKGGEARAERGVEFFGRLKSAGNLAASAQAASVIVDWDYHNAARAAGNKAWKVAIPRDAVLGSYYVQAISKKAPHPAAARLWQEFLFSDRGQNLFLKGYARPARMEALRMRGTLDTELAAKLPTANAEPVVLTVAEIDTARGYLKRAWAEKIG
ncbi:putative spermidine/putrescine transport system substrate-binding protein [Streptosporangium becharense]|uniref:Putative spermidine/putrescine transport system substrate-binding protein n=1 Tax=Streptosporangium becharense TaxID=1816182 RepID=A0A7W9IJH4_9ACTN|nr:extracellular solute-binding protein [Streptosporangium becharense]MBB2913494.1 putative spermidine/putrescine transport system substrate-binding protein [Streptosporangium becharense]MBB5821184.1 putative spermidine/putrescine transport system substrate-binding protein [Streptosporangium becharense]